MRLLHGGVSYIVCYHPDNPVMQCLLLQPPPPHIWLGASLPQAMGIFAVALSGPSGSALPTLRGTMKHPQNFRRVLLIALGVMTGVYALMGALGYFYFGSGASQLITADLETKSVLAHMHIFGNLRVRAVLAMSSKWQLHYPDGGQIARV